MTHCRDCLLEAQACHRTNGLRFALFSAAIVLGLAAHSAVLSGDALGKQPHITTADAAVDTAKKAANEADSSGADSQPDSQLKEPPAEPAASQKDIAPRPTEELAPGLKTQKPAKGIFVETSQGYMVPYRQILPGTKVVFEMIPIPGGTFSFDSSGKDHDTANAVMIEVGPFWMAKHEVTWAEYRQFMDLYPRFKQLEKLRTVLAGEGEAAKQARKQVDRRAELKRQLKAKPQLDEKRQAVDAITCPTPLYYPEVTFESGEDPNLPAVTMTPYAARQYTKWLSGVLGQTYRLPSEAEWEYAARAGSNAPFFFGDDPKKLGEHAWYVTNAEDRSQLVGQKKPNSWGLHDMLGNVAEIVLDEYVEDRHLRLKERQTSDRPLTAQEATLWPTKQYPRVVRGGSWLDESSDCQCATRLATDDLEWKTSDPNLPHSPWWYTELYPAGGIGFRIARPLTPLTAEQKQKAWEIDAKRLFSDVGARLEEGRGSMENVNLDFPRVIKQLDDPLVRGLLE